MTRYRHKAGANRRALHNNIFHHLLRTMTVPPSGTTHPEMVEYARTSTTTTLPDIQAHFTQTWRPQPITIKDMARRLANRWFKVTREQTSAQHNASAQQDDPDQHGASISDANQRHASVQLPLPALQVSTTPARSETLLSSKRPLSSPANLKQEEAAPANLKQEEESKWPHLHPCRAVSVLL